MMYKRKRIFSQLRCEKWAATKSHGHEVEKCYAFSFVSSWLKSIFIKKYLTLLKYLTIKQLTTLLIPFPNQN